MPQLADYPLPTTEITTGVNTLLDAARSFNQSMLDNTLTTVAAMNEEQRTVYNIVTKTITDVITATVPINAAATSTSSSYTAANVATNNANITHIQHDQPHP